MMWALLVLGCGGKAGDSDPAGAGGTGGGATVTPGGGEVPEGVECGPEKVDAWVLGTRLREPLESMAAAGIGGVVYVVGGWTEQGPTDVATRGDFDAEGKLAWGPTTVYPTALERPGSIAVAGRMYVVGGDDGMDNLDAVWSSAPDAAGDLAPWREETPLPEPTSTPSLAATTDRIYVVGGYAGGGLGDVTRNVWSAPIGADGALGAWREETPLKKATWGAAVGVSGNGSLVAAGGFQGEDATDAAMAAPIGADGAVGDWANDGLLTDPQAPTALQFGVHLVTVGGVYFNGAASDKGIAADLTDGWPTSLLSLASLPTGRYGHGLVFAGTSLVSVGGLSSPAQMSDDVRVAEFCR
jgi:hypothetical protein